MPIPPDTSFKKEDFPSTGLGSTDVLDKLFLPLNSFLQTVRSLLTNGLTFTQNMNAEIKTFTVVAPTSGTGVLSCFPITMKTKVPSPQGILLWNATDKQGTDSPPALGCPSWVPLAGGQVKVTNIPGLVLGRTYTVTLLIVGG